MRLLAAILLALLPVLDARAQTEAETQLATPVSTAAIPVPAIAGRAADVSEQLRRIDATASPSRAVNDIAEQLPAISDTIRAFVQSTERAKQEHESLDGIEDLTSSWRSFDEGLTAWKSTLTDRATELERDLARLSELRQIWEGTRRAAESSSAPDAVLQRIQATLAAIRATTDKVQRRRAQILTLQDSVVAQQATVNRMLDDVGKLREQLVRRLFVPDRPPIWRLARQSGDLRSTVAGTRATLQRQGTTLWRFLERRATLLPLHAGIILLLGFLALRARRAIAGWAKQEKQLETVARIFAVPFSIALLLGLVATPWIYPDAPGILVDLAGLIALLPAIRILRRLVERPLIPALHALGVFYVVDRLRAAIVSAPVLEQGIFLLEMIAAIAVLLRLLRPPRAAQPAKDAGAVRVRVGTPAIRTAITVFGLAIFASLLGYGRLSELLGGGALNSIYLGLILYATVRTADGLVAYVLRSHPLQRLNLVRRHRPLIGRRLRRALRWIAFAGWVAGTLHLFALAAPATALVSDALGARFTRGSVSISLGDVVAFGLTVWIAFLLSRFLRFLLDEDVYPRFGLAPGIPYAASALLHYAILLLGFFFAVAAVGIDIGRLAFLLGAFGVGLGFGLQNVVNNFVSGLILLFERPIQVGDVVQLSDLNGVVKRIGIRSSTIRTWDGAEVIVPNGNLISEQLTNWTLSDRMRRIEIPVGVAYGTDPAKVLEILAGVAAENPDVLDEPHAVSLFLGFGDSSLDFELRAWTGQYENWIPVRSQLVLAIHAALKRGGIEIPFPQRDLHLRSVDSGVQRAFGGRTPADEGGGS